MQQKRIVNQYYPENMKYLLLLTVLSSMTVSCHNIPQKQFREAYIQEFKLVYFKSCLNNTFNNTEIRHLNKTDKSGMSEPILGADVYSLIDSLTRVDASGSIRLSGDSGELSEGSEGIAAYRICLNAYTGKRVERLAKRRYREVKKAL